MLKKSASGVLASLRGSTYRSVRLASSLAAALLGGLFEHPAWCTSDIPDVRVSKSYQADLAFQHPASFVERSLPTGQIDLCRQEAYPPWHCRPHLN
jgi:hypothetical protein